MAGAASTLAKTDLGGISAPWGCRCVQAVLTRVHTRGRQLNVPDQSPILPHITAKDGRICVYNALLQPFEMNSKGPETEKLDRNFIFTQM